MANRSPKRAARPVVRPKYLTCSTSLERQLQASLDEIAQRETGGVVVQEGEILCEYGRGLVIEELGRVVK